MYLMDYEISRLKVFSTLVLEVYGAFGDEWLVGVRKVASKSQKFSNRIIHIYIPENSSLTYFQRYTIRK